jgi:hypothetical protein
MTTRSKEVEMQAKAGKSQKSTKAGKTFLTIEIDPLLRDDMHIQARMDGKNLKEWFDDLVRRNVKRHRSSAVAHAR